jgi:AcrR family transcriptional regulator
VIDRSVKNESTDTGARVRRAALELFAKKGYAATGIREIASEAGVTTAALYHYMDDKEQLLLDIMRGGMEDFNAKAKAAIKEANSPREELAALARTHVISNGERIVQAYVSDNEIRSLDDSGRAEILKLRDKYEAFWRKAIANGVKSGDFLIPNQKLFRLSVIQMCNGIINWYSPGGGASLEEIADELATFALVMAGYRSDLEPEQPPARAAKTDSK